MDKVDPKDQAVRHAILESYKHRCFYSDELISIQDMELDHIIPKSLKNHPEKLYEIFKQQQLNLNFELDSLYNLVPTTRKNNNRKSNIELPPAILAVNLEKARSKVPLILGNIEKYIRNIKQDKHLSLLKGAVQNNKITPEKIYNFVSEDNEEFTEEINLFEQDGAIIYKHYTKEIALEATMPVYTDINVNCVFSFRTLKIRDCIMVLNNITILEELFKGLFSDPIYGMRGIIEYESYIENSDEIDLGNVIIRLGNNKFKISKNEIYLLCKIIDAFAEQYFKAINKIESILKTQRFQLSKDKTGYKLMRVSSSQWLKLIEYSDKMDVDKGDSEWHIFDKNPYFIRIYTNKVHPIYLEGYHSLFRPEYNEEKVKYPFLEGDNVWIVWELFEDMGRRGAEHFNEKENWDAETAYNWLANCFLPRALIQVRKKKRYIHEFMFSKKNYKDRVFSDIYSNDCIEYLSLEDVKTDKMLYELVARLQVYYNGYPGLKFRLTKSELQGIYESILISISKDKNIDLYYISGKLRVANVKSILDLIESIKDIIRNIKECNVNGFDIDLLMRSLLVAVGAENSHLTEKEINDILVKLKPVVEIYNTQVLLDKYALD